MPSSLPHLLAITGTAQTNTQFCQRLEHALTLRPDGVLYRDRALPPEQWQQRGQIARDMCRCAGLPMLAATSSYEDALAIGADGLHLSASTLLRLQHRHGELLLGASCHSLAELKAAQSLMCDYALLSPVRQPISHPSGPQHKALGLSGLQTLIDATKLPIYALGGMKPEDLDWVCSVGGQGVAGIHWCWADATERP